LFGIDEPGGVVGPTVDPQTAGQSFQRDLQIPLRLAKGSLSDDCRDVCIDPSHFAILLD
jgi:hypothetical protein